MVVHSYNSSYRAERLEDRGQRPAQGKNVRPELENKQKEKGQGSWLNC
jgi:hypothetical protein